MKITEKKVTVVFDNKTYEFNRHDNDRLSPINSDIPYEVSKEVKSRGFFIQEYPTTFTWTFCDRMYDFDDVLNDVPDNIIQPKTKEHSSLYHLVAGKYGGVKMEITVGDDGYCRFTDVLTDIPVKGVMRD